MVDRLFFNVFFENLKCRITFVHNSDRLIDLIKLKVVFTTNKLNDGHFFTMLLSATHRFAPMNP